MWFVRRRLERFLPSEKANFWCHVIDGAFISLAFGIVGGGGVFQAVAEKLGASGTFMGMLNSIAGFSVLAPLVAAPMVEAAGRKKRLVLALGLGQRLPFIAVPLILLGLAVPHPYASLLLIALVQLIAGIMVSVLVPPWTDLLAETIPGNRLGRLFGYRETIGSAVVFVAGPISALIISAWDFPYNFAALYGVAFGAAMCSWLAFALVDEAPSKAEAREKKGAVGYFRDLLRRVAKDSAYKWLLVSNMLAKTGMAITALYTFAVLRYFGMTRSIAVGMAMTVPPAAKMAGNLFFARLGEKMGYKRVLGLASLLNGAGAVVAALSPNGWWYAGAFLLSGLSAAARTVSGAPFMMQVAPGEKRVGYVTLMMVFMAPVGIGAAFLAGYLMDVLGPRRLFLLAALASSAAVIPLRWSHPKAPEDTSGARPDDEPASTG